MAPIRYSRLFGKNAELPFVEDEKSVNHPSPTHGRRNATSKMPSTRRFLFGLLVLFAVGFGLTTAVFPRGRVCQDDSKAVQESVMVEEQQESAFSRLLKSASPDALHKILHSYFPAYKHGVYPSDESAMEAVSVEDAPLATALVELAKRQNTTSDTSTTSSTEVSSTTSAESTTSSPSSDTSTTSPTSQTTSATSESTTTAPPETTTTPTSTPTTSQITTVITTTGATGQTTTETTTTPVTTGGSSTGQSGTSTTQSPTPTSTSSQESSQESSTSTTGTSTIATSSALSTTVASSSSITTSKSSPLTSTPTSTSVSPISTSSSPSSPSAAESNTQGTTTGHTNAESTSRWTSRKTSTFTSTLPGGGATTLTSVYVVTGGGESATATGSGGSLQSGVAVPAIHGGPILEVVVGAVIGGALLI